MIPPLPVAAVQLGAIWKSPSNQTPPVLPGISLARPRPRGPETQQLRAQRQLRGPQSCPGGPPPGRSAWHPWAGSAQHHLGALKNATCPGRHRPAESEPASSQVPWRLQHEEEHFWRPCPLLQPPLLGHLHLSYMCGPAADALKMLLSHSPPRVPGVQPDADFWPRPPGDTWSAASARHRAQGGWGVAGGP